MRYLTPLLLLLLALPLAAEPYYMSIARDLEKTGDIASHTDDMDMRMTWLYNHPSWLVEEGFRDFFEDGEYGLEKTVRNKNDVYMESRWLVQHARQVPFTLRNAEQIRTMLTARIKAVEENKTEVVLTVALQVQDTQRIASGWVDRSERLAREYIWIAASSAGIVARYPVSNEAKFKTLLEDYRKKGKRHGVEGYELPPREVAVKPKDLPSDTAPTAGASGGGSLADELKKLKELFDAGAITQEEYQTAKAKLLGN